MIDEIACIQTFVMKQKMRFCHKQGAVPNVSAVHKYNSCEKMEEKIMDFMS